MGKRTCLTGQASRNALNGLYEYMSEDAGCSITKWLPAEAAKWQRAATRATMALAALTLREVCQQPAKARSRPVLPLDMNTHVEQTGAANSRPFGRSRLTAAKAAKNPTGVKMSCLGSMVRMSNVKPR